MIEQAKPPLTGLVDALVAAAHAGALDRVRELAAAGADLDAADAYGDVALTAAAQQGHDAVVEFLLDRGADLAAGDRDGDTALDLARYHGRARTVALLQARGAAGAAGASAKELMLLALEQVRAPAAAAEAPGRELERLCQTLAASRDGAGVWRTIAESARRILRADGCTFYRVRQNRLHVEILLTASLGLALDASTGRGPIAAPTPIYLADGAVDDSSLAACCAAACDTINVADVAQLPAAQRSQLFDARMNYRTISVLSEPVVSRGEVFGVLQFVNALDGSGRVTAFGAMHQPRARALAALVALARILFDRL